MDSPTDRRVRGRTGRELRSTTITLLALIVGVIGRHRADCVRYNPATLTVDGTAASGTFVVSSGSTVVMRLDGENDSVAPQAFALAQRYTEHC